MEHDRVFDRLTPTSWGHITKYPIQLGVRGQEPVGPMPVIVGTNWYRWMSNPVYDASDRRWWIGRDIGDWGQVLGGHCYCLKPESVPDPVPWWDFYDQGQEGACVGFGSARAMTLVDRKRFDARRIYLEAQKIDEWAGEAYSGTSVDAGVAVLRREGAAVIKGRYVSPPKMEHGIKANRWATSIADLYGCLQSPRQEKQGVIALLNSWGKYYSHITYMPAEHMERLLREYGEATCFTPS